MNEDARQRSDKFIPWSGPSPALRGTSHNEAGEVKQGVSDVARRNALECRSSLVQQPLGLRIGTVYAAAVPDRFEQCPNRVIPLVISEEGRLEDLGRQLVPNQ